MNFPLPIPEKVNTPELEAYFQSFSPQLYLSADEINMMIQALNELHLVCLEQKITSDSLGQAVTTFPEAEIIYDTDEFNFTSNLDHKQYRIEYLKLLDNLRGVFQSVLTSGQTLKTVNNTSLLGSGNVDVKFTPIYHELLSSALTTQDVTGIRNYLNALTPNIVISSNSVLKVIVTNTGQLFEVKVNGRTIGSGQTALHTSDIALLNLSTSALSNTFLPKVSTTGVERVYTINANGSQGTKPFKDCRLSYGYPTQSVTGTTALTKVLGGLLVPSKAFDTGDSLTLRVRMIRTVPTSSNSTVYVYCSTSATVTSVTDPSLKSIAYFSATGTQTVVQGKIELAIRNAWDQTEVVNYTNNTDDQGGTDVRTISIVWPTDVYFYVFIGNTQTTTSAYVSFFELYKK